MRFIGGLASRRSRSSALTSAWYAALVPIRPCCISRTERPGAPGLRAGPVGYRSRTSAGLGSESKWPSRPAGSGHQRSRRPRGSQTFTHKRHVKLHAGYACGQRSALRIGLASGLNRRWLAAALLPAIFCRPVGGRSIEKMTRVLSIGAQYCPRIGVQC